jgi:hypothetical protein
MYLSEGENTGAGKNTFRGKEHAWHIFRDKE